jgi:hypothetical protein
MPGAIVYRKFTLPSGTVEAMADAVIEGTTLHLKDVAVYPLGAQKLELGAGVMKSLLNSSEIAIEIT